MQTSCQYLNDEKTYRLKIWHDVTEGENRNIEQKKCEICGEWFDIDQIQEREEHTHCEGEKCSEAVTRMIYLENLENE